MKGRLLLVTTSNVASFPSRLRHLGSVQTVQTGFPVPCLHGVEAEGSGSHRREDNVALASTYASENDPFWLVSNPNVFSLPLLGGPGMSAWPFHVPWGLIWEKLEWYKDTLTCRGHLPAFAEQ